MTLHKYIHDKTLYKAVMFALDMCNNDIRYAKDDKITVAANYYNVNRQNVLSIVRSELWTKAKEQAKCNNEWYTIFNPEAPEILDTGFGRDYVWICPNCEYVQSANVHDDYTGDLIFVSPCPCCGWIDKSQQITRMDFINWLKRRKTNNDARTSN